MINNKLKNIIVLKGMASNVVQEAIVILRPNVEFEKCKTLYKNKENTIFNNKKKSVVSEAEFVINNYIKEIETNTSKRNTIKLEKKYNIFYFINNKCNLKNIIKKNEYILIYKSFF